MAKKDSSIYITLRNRDRYYRTTSADTIVHDRNNIIQSKTGFADRRSYIHHGFTDRKSKQLPETTPHLQKEFREDNDLRRKHLGLLVREPLLKATFLA